MLAMNVSSLFVSKLGVAEPAAALPVLATLWEMCN
jgi:hypothetical protein